jgi:hypothetical protein
VDDEDDLSPSTTQRDYIPAVNIRLKGIMMGHPEVLLVSSPRSDLKTCPAKATE